MMLWLLLSIGLSLILFVLSLVLKLAGKLRMTLPVVYFLLLCTVFNPWAAKHEKLAFAILGMLVLMSLVSWIRSLCQKLRERRYYQAIAEDIAWQSREARTKGVDLHTVYFDSEGNMRDNATDQIIH